MRGLLATAFVLSGVLLTSVGHAQTAAGSAGTTGVFRCEGRDGRVTYANTPCPETARTVRRVDDTPPVLVREPASAKEGASKDAPKETTEAATAEAAPNSSPTPSAAPPTAAKAVSNPGATPEAAGSAQLSRVRSGSPEQQMQRLDEERARQRVECAELQKKIDYARNDLQTASGSQRASAELSLRRLQEQRLVACPRG